MTKKDYELIADAIQQAYTSSPEWKHMRSVYEAAERIADAMQRDNQAFKRGMFMRRAVGAEG